MTSCACPTRWRRRRPDRHLRQTGTPAAEGPIITADVDRLITELLTAAPERFHCPGIAYGLIVGGVLTRSGGVGSVVPGGATPASSTLYRIASMTKSFTASAVLQLRDRGLLHLDDEVERWVPQLQLTMPTTDSPPVTVRQLLTMASGLSTDDPWADRHLDADRPFMDALFAAGGTFATAPATAMVYSNYGYAILGRVIEAVSGVAPQRYISEHLLEPLGMSSTGWTSDHLRADTMRTDDLRTDDLEIAPPFRWQDDALVPDDEPIGDGGFASMGGLWSTVEDLARWVAFQCDAFPARNDPDDGPLRRSSRREQQQVWRDRPPGSSHSGQGRVKLKVAGYGMGLMITHHDDLGLMVGHGGGLPGYGSHMRWIPHHGIGVVLLANVTYARMGDLSLELLELLHRHGAIPSAPSPIAPDLQRRTDTLVALLNDWDQTVADELFADNVFADDSAARRKAAAAELVAAHGRLRVVEINPTNATEARITLVGERPDAASATVHLDVQLSPQVPPLLQFYEVITTALDSAAADEDDAHS